MAHINTDFPLVGAVPLSQIAPIPGVFKLNAELTLKRSSARMSIEVKPMNDTAKRATVYFEPEIHQALRVKAATTHVTISELVNEAVREALREDEEDLAAFEQRAGEHSISYEDLLKDLKAHGKI